MGAKYTEAQKKATLAHLKNVGEFRVRTSKEYKKLLQEKIHQSGYKDSINQFFIDAAEEKILRMENGGDKTHADI